jgi:hypothetical protein
VGNTLNLEVFMNGATGEILPLATHWTSTHIATVLSSFADAPKERAMSATAAKSVGEHDAIRDLPV